ncbi:MAG: trimethylamine methyltransferase family protein [Anaerolineales bacterium]|nr:trimethylamine methyltransferase family protein [Anaerolineales bacterium]
MNFPNSSSTNPPQFSVLTESDKRSLHFAALEILRRTGIRFHHAGALEMLAQAGAFISDGNLVKFPSRMVEDAISTVPSRIIMCDRSGEAGVFLEGNHANFGTGSDCLNLLDPGSGERRKFTKQDLIDGYHLCDALPNIDFVMSLGIPEDVDPDLTYNVQMALMLEHTVKPLVFVTEDRASCQRAIDMAAAVVGGIDALRETQHILLYSEPSSPLQQSDTAIDKLLLMAEVELPVVHSPAPLMGGTGPITMASGLAMSIAEIMSSMVVHQMRNPGAPFVFGAGLHHMDMRAAQICYASPEFQLTKSAIAEMGRWYSMPTWGYAGCTDAKVLDGQAALEALLSVIMARFCGSNLVHDVGYMESGLTCSFEMIVLTDELIQLADHMMKGIEINTDSLMLDEIDEVGPGGHFLNTPGTLSRFRDFWYPALLDRNLRSTWLDNGGTTLEERLRDKVQNIIAEHHVEPIGKDAKRGIEKILARAS